MTEPALTFIIPLVRINDYVRETVWHLQHLREPNWEAIIVTNDLEPTEWGDDNRIRVMESGAVGPAFKRDLAAKVSRGSILTFIDDDSYPNHLFIDQCLEAFNQNYVSAVGGPALTPDSDTFWQHVSGAVFMSRLTGGNPSRYRSVGKLREIDDWPSVNLSIRRDDFIKVGGFDTEYWPGEDTFLCWKLKQRGMKIVYMPELVVWHHRREGFARHLRQVGAYGLHRGYFARHYPSTSCRLRYFLPSLLLLALLISPILLFVSRTSAIFALCAWIVYCLALVVGIIEVSRLTTFRIGFCSIPYVVGTHFCYGATFLRGLFKVGSLRSRLRK